mgnify:FL=1
MPNLKGTIISTKMANTVVVSIAYTMRHKKYGKILKRTTRLLAHSELPGLSVGDVVEITQTRPYSKSVYFKVEKKS